MKKNTMNTNKLNSTCGVPNCTHKGCLRRIAWEAECSDQFDLDSELYYAVRAIEQYGNELRDNSFDELVAIGKEVERDYEFL